MASHEEGQEGYEEEQPLTQRFKTLAQGFKYPVTLFNWKKLMIAVWSGQFMVFVSMVTLMKPNWDALTTTCVFTAMVTPLLGYAIVLLNMFNGGWGREESKFWCNLRIMYLSGYNTIRWCSATIVDPCIVMAATKIMGEDSATTIWSGLCIVYTYYTLANVEISKGHVVDWEKYKNDFDIDLKHAHEIQLKNVVSVDTKPILVCTVLTLIPWIATGWNVGFVIMVYQILMNINIYLYASALQTFVVTDTQFDILQATFRIILTWTYIFIA